MRAIFSLFLSLFFTVSAIALEHPGSALQEVGVRPILGAKVDTSLRFTDSTGKEVSLAELATPGKPIIIVPAYFGCPRLCGLVLKGVAKMLSSISLELGRDFSVLSVSFDEREGPRFAAEAFTTYHNLLPEAQKNNPAWHFLVGKKENVKSLMDQIGFYYKRDGEEFAHGAALMILTPEGQISQYFTGIDFSPFDVKLALIEAAKGEIGSALDHALMFCFRFDETKGKYTWAVFNFMRLGAGATLVFLVWLVFSLWRRERESKRRLA